MQFFRYVKINLLTFINILAIDFITLIRIFAVSLTFNNYNYENKN